MSKLIVGLGNPGKKYESTRHNAGFMVLDALAAEAGLDWEEHKKTDCLLADWQGTLLAKPLTFMNNSGLAVRKLCDYFKLNTSPASLPNTLTVVHDDLDIALGDYRIKYNSGSAGHKGVDSVINHLGSRNFTRFRMGIKTEKLAHIPADKFVLQKFSSEEMNELQNATGQVIRDIKSREMD